jgi:hypothetical protein
MELNTALLIVRSHNTVSKDSADNFSTERPTHAVLPADFNRSG